jgi:hypothetical protein
MTNLRQAQGRLGIVWGARRPWAVRGTPGLACGTVWEGQGRACPWEGRLGTGWGQACDTPSQVQSPVIIHEEGRGYRSPSAPLVCCTNQQVINSPTSRLGFA